MSVERVLRAPLFAVPAVVLLTLFAGCQQRAADSSVQDSAAATSAAVRSAPEPRDPCRLVQASEAEAVLGAPLAVAPFRAGAPNHEDAGTPRADGPACWYQTADFRNLAVQATWTGGGALIAGVGSWLAKAESGSGGLVKLQDGSELTGEWDEVRMLGCCDFMALRGDSVVEIDFGGSFATAEQAGALADAALRRLDAPLPFDGRDALAAAEQRDAIRPKAESPCSLWDAADLEATVGILEGTPEVSGDSCTYRYEADDGRPHLFVSTVVWRNGYRKYRESNQMLAKMAAGLASGLGDGDAAMTRVKTIEGPWDAAQSSAIQFNSVRHDVSISLRQSGMSPEDIRALLGRAYDKLERSTRATP